VLVVDSIIIDKSGISLHYISAKLLDFVFCLFAVVLGGFSNAVCIRSKMSPYAVNIVEVFSAIPVCSGL
jgi:hypothetical protein